MTDREWLRVVKEEAVLADGPSAMWLTEEQVEIIEQWAAREVLHTPNALGILSACLLWRAER